MPLKYLILPDEQTAETCRGFTLIEVLIAMAIFAIGILAIAGLQIRSINLNASSRMQSEATIVAIDVMERLARLPYEHPDLDESAGTWQNQVGVYTVFWKITGESPISWCKTIAVWVTADNPNARVVRLNFIRGPEW
jgi:prepilin-type N-terminal cleavage/methylation domain-containing protein